MERIGCGAIAKPIWGLRLVEPLRSDLVPYTLPQGQAYTEGILQLVNPKLGSNSGMRNFELRMLGLNSGVEVFAPVLFQYKDPLKNSPSRDSPPEKLKNWHCTSAGPCR